MKILQYMFGAWVLASTLYPCQTQAVPPVAPSNLFAVSVSSSKLDLIWTDNASNESSFRLEFSPTAAFTNPTLVPQIIRANTTRFSHTGRSGSTTYWYRIQASNSQGPSGFSNTAFATTAPGGVDANAPSRNGRIDVSWTPNPANNKTTGYTVRYGTRQNFSDAVYRWVAGKGSSTYAATGLVPNQRYYASVKAVVTVENNTYSSAFSAADQATTLPPLLTGPRIAPFFFGQNAWMPYKIGTDPGGVRYGDLETLLCGPRYDREHSTGVCVPAEVHASGVKLMRYGGSAADKYYDPTHKGQSLILTMVDNMSTNGIEPLLQVAYYNEFVNGVDGDAQGRSKHGHRRAGPVRIRSRHYERAHGYERTGHGHLRPIHRHHWHPALSSGHHRFPHLSVRRCGEDPRRDHCEATRRF